MLLAIAAVFGVPRVKEEIEARRRTEPIVAMLRKGTNESIVDAKLAITGYQYADATRKKRIPIPDFTPLPPRAAEKVQREIIRTFPGVDHDVSLVVLFISLLWMELEDRTLALDDADWRVVEDAMRRYNAMQPAGGERWYIYVEPDGRKRIETMGPRIH